MQHLFMALYLHFGGAGKFMENSKPTILHTNPVLSLF